MSVSPVGPANVTSAAPPPTTNRNQDQDQGQDHKITTNNAPQQPTPAPGTGQVVNKTV